MNHKRPPYVIFARRPACGCLMAISYYDPAGHSAELKDTAREVAGWVKEGFLISTLPFDQHPLNNGEKFGCVHERQISFELEVKS